MVGLFDLALRSQFLLELLLERTHDEAVLRFHRVVLAESSIHFELRALQTLLPLSVQPLPFVFEIRRHFEADLESSRLEGLQDELHDMLVDESTTEISARLSTV